MQQLHLKTNQIKRITLILAALTALSPFAIDSYLAAIPLMTTYFGVKISVIELTITLYFLGFAIGNFFGGPLSDAYGRKPVALIGVLLYSLSALLIPFCDSIELIFILRIFQAFGGGFATVTSNLFIRDWYKGDQVARLITITAMIMMLAPLFAPILGSVLVHYSGWETVFYFMFCFALLLFVIFYLLIPESRNEEELTKTITANQLIEKYKLIFLERDLVILILAVCFSFSGLYAFITSSSFIYLDYFGLDAKMFPIVFGANIVLNILLSFANTYLLKFYKPKYLLQVGLFIQLLTGFLLFLVIILEQDNFWNIFVLIALFIGSLGLIFGNGSAIILGLKPELSGSSNATLGITRFLLGFILGTLIAIFHTDDLKPVAIIMFLCTLIGNVLYQVYKKSHNKALVLENAN